MVKDSLESRWIGIDEGIERETAGAVRAVDFALHSRIGYNHGRPPAARTRTPT